jgi:hypothetical protein
MFFVSYNQSADLSLTTPPDFCCNCGARKELELANTPLRKTRYFLFFGTELTLNETFPYCQDCAVTAARVRPGWLAKGLTVCLVTSVVFLAMVLFAASLPKSMSENLFRNSVLISILLTALFYYVREWSRNDRSYYQPVRLVDAKLDGDQILQYRLKFFNPKYATVFRRANQDLIRAGVLKVDEN